MGFKQNNYFNQFMRSSRQRLLEVGVPLRTLEHDAWDYFLAHSECICTNWTIDDLNHEQLGELLEVVKQYQGYNDHLVQQIGYRIADAKTSRQHQP